MKYPKTPKSVVAGGEPLARLLPPYIPPPPPRAPSFPGPNSKPSLPCRNPSLSPTTQVSSQHPQEDPKHLKESPPPTPSLCDTPHPPPSKRPQTPTSAKNHSAQLSVPASDDVSLYHPLDLSSVTEPLTEVLLLHLLQEHHQVDFLEQQLFFNLQQIAGGAGEHFGKHSGAQITGWGRPGPTSQGPRSCHCN